MFLGPYTNSGDQFGESECRISACAPLRVNPEIPAARMAPEPKESMTCFDNDQRTQLSKVPLRRRGPRRQPAPAYALTMNRVLHIVDGDSTGGTIRVPGLARSKDILCWRDALYTGPVPAGLSLRQLSRVRSSFWTSGKSSRDLDKRDAALANQGRYDHVVLWFGPNCVLCQLSLMQLLSWFREQKVSPRRLSWVALHGGELRPDQISAAFQSRRPIMAAQMRIADRVWRAFQQPSPEALARLPDADLGAIPRLRRPLMRILQEYPSMRNGLSRLETLLLREIQKCGSVRAAVAVGVILQKEPVGDMLLFDMLREFVEAPYPLLHLSSPFVGKIKSWRFNGSALKLSDIGERVLAGKADAIELNGIDRWIGGVHLQGTQVRWRWSPRLRTIAGAG